MSQICLSHVDQHSLCTSVKGESPLNDRLGYSFSNATSVTCTFAQTSSWYRLFILNGAIKHTIGRGWSIAAYSRLIGTQKSEEWRRLLEVADYKSAKNRFVKEALYGGVKPGSRVDIHLRISPEQRAEIQGVANPTYLFSLLRHEHKRTSCNVSINLSADYEHTLKSILDCSDFVQIRPCACLLPLSLYICD